MFVKMTLSYLFKQNDSYIICFHSHPFSKYKKTMVGHLARFFATLRSETNDR